MIRSSRYSLLLRGGLLALLSAIVIFVTGAETPAWLALCFALPVISSEEKQVQKKSLPAGWWMVKLGDLGEIITGKTPSLKNPEDWGNEIPFVTPTDYKNYGKFVFSAERMLSKKGIERLEKIVLPPNSIMVTCIGYTGKIAVNKVNAVTNQQINSIIPNCEIVDLDFLYYSLINIHEHFQMLGSRGTVVPIINKGIFEEIHLIVAPLPEQKTIAKVLGNLDDKIYLLRRQNKTLESMAQTLFRKRFIGDATKGWKDGKLGDIVELEIGERVAKGEPNYLEIGDINLSTKDYNIDGKEKRTVSNAVKVPKDTLLISTVRPTRGAITITKDEINVSGAFTKIKCHNKLGYCFVQQLDFFEYLGGISSGTTYPTCKDNDILNYKIMMPPQEIINEFNGIFAPYFDKIQRNRLQVRTLAKMRDLLLPKLMSGKARVKEFIGKQQ